MSSMYNDMPNCIIPAEVRERYPDLAILIQAIYNALWVVTRSTRPIK
jgi:hypothetical protein